MEGDRSRNQFRHTYRNRNSNSNERVWFPFAVVVRSRGCCCCRSFGYGDKPRLKTVRFTLYSNLRRTVQNKNSIWLDNLSHLRESSLLDLLTRTSFILARQSRFVVIIKTVFITIVASKHARLKLVEASRNTARYVDKVEQEFAFELKRATRTTFLSPPFR